MPGLENGKLAPCPSSPNCVSSHHDPADRGHYVDPIAFDDPPGDLRRRLVKVVSAMPGATLVSEEANYLHFTFTTSWMRFVDDVELLIDPDDKTVHIRSASRLGYGDFGVNRKRVEHIRSLMKP